MASQIAACYASAFATLTGEKFSAKEVRVIMTSQFPSLNPASLNPSDYCGVRGMDGKVTRSSSQAMQYAPLFFVKDSSGLYEVLPQNEQVGKPLGSRSLRGVSDDAIRAELVRRGVLKAPATE
jgi:hypothetical protein